MVKVVVNRSYGGFELSHEAVMEYLKSKEWNVDIKLDEIYVKTFKERYPNVEPTPEKLEKEFGIWVVHYYIEGEGEFNPLLIPRDDPDLVKVVEQLGEKANGKFSRLEVVEIPDYVDWIICEYNGVEWVVDKNVLLASNRLILEEDSPVPRYERIEVEKCRR